MKQIHQAGLDAAWQDAKLLLSFAVGIIFMRSLEMLTIGAGALAETYPEVHKGAKVLKRHLYTVKEIGIR